ERLGVVLHGGSAVALRDLAEVDLHLIDMMKVRDDLHVALAELAGLGLVGGRECRECECGDDGERANLHGGTPWLNSAPGSAIDGPDQRARFRRCARLPTFGLAPW